jgi:hypothetical protein
LYIIVQVHPTGIILTDIGKSVERAPILWWSIISTRLASDISSAVCAASLWSTKTTSCPFIAPAGNTSGVSTLK